MQKPLHLASLTLLAAALLAGCGGATEAPSTQTPPVAPLSKLTALVVGDSRWQYADDAVTASFDGAALTALDSPLAKLRRFGSAELESHHEDGLAWGRWQGAGAAYDQTAFAWQPASGLQYAVFDPTAKLPAGGAVAYHLYSGTRPVANGVAGTLLNAAALVQFDGAGTTVGLEFNLDAGGLITASTLGGAAPIDSSHQASPLTSVGTGSFLTLPMPQYALGQADQRYDGVVKSLGVLPCGANKACALRVSASFTGANADFLVVAYTLQPVQQPYSTAYFDSAQSAATMPPDAMRYSTGSTTIDQRTLFRGNYVPEGAIVQPPALEAGRTVADIAVSGIMVLQRNANH